MCKFRRKPYPFDGFAGQPVGNNGLLKNMEEKWLKKKKKNNEEIVSIGWEQILAFSYEIPEYGGGGACISRVFDSVSGRFAENEFSCETYKSRTHQSNELKHYLLSGPGTVISPPLPPILSNNFALADEKAVLEWPQTACVTVNKFCVVPSNATWIRKVEKKTRKKTWRYGI